MYVNESSLGCHPWLHALALMAPAAYIHSIGKSQFLPQVRTPRRALVCFQRQVEAQCDAVAPRPCSIYVASDSGAVSRPLDAEPGPDLDPWRRVLSWVQLLNCAHAVCPAAMDRQVLMHLT